MMRRCATKFFTSPKIHDHSLGTFRVAGTGQELANKVGEVVNLRARVSRTRVKGKKVGFMQIRQSPTDSIQAVAVGEELVAKVKALTPESIVDVEAVLEKANTPIQSTSCKDFELQLKDLTIVSTAATPLPFPLEDENTALHTRNDHRVIDLRTTQTGLIMRITSEVNRFFREYLHSQDFIEIHTPKTIGTPSEGGSAVFSLKYFDKEAYLAQSPQLYKQMVLMGDGMRVMEIGPVFRAENSLSHRHATEYVGLDAELVIKQHYFEVLEILEGTMCHIIGGLQEEGSKAAKLVEQLNATMNPMPTPIVAKVSEETVKELGMGTEVATGEVTTPSTDKYGARISLETRVLRMSFRNAARFLADEGVVDTADIDDFNTAQEKQLGVLIKKRYGIDLYIVDRFMLSARPFYTMLEGTDGETRSYDMYLRGEEICSGAQRLHDPTLLQQRAAECGVSTELIKDYVDSFRYGAWPHGGFGLGMERIVLFFLGMKDIRQIALFARDPKRITP